MHADLRIGSIVRLPGGEKGLLKYVGPIQGKAGEFAGVEMLQGYEDHGKHSGTFEGVNYFTTSKPDTGVFLSYSRLIGTNIKSSPVSRRSSVMLTARAEFSPNKRMIPSPKKSTLPETPRRASRIPPTPNRKHMEIFSPSENLRPSSRSSVRRPTVRSTSNSSTSSLQDEVKSLTSQLNSAQEQLTIKDSQLEEQLAMIRDMEISLNEVQEIVQTHQQDPDVDIEVMRKSLIDKDNKISMMKTEFEHKRMEFRQYIESLEHAIKQRDDEYQKTFREYDENENIKQLKHTIAELTGKLASSEEGEKTLRIQLSQLAGVENKLLDKEQEIRDFREQINVYKTQLEAGVSSDGLAEVFEMEKKKTVCLEGLLAEKENEIQQIREILETKEMEIQNIQKERDLDYQKNNNDLVEELKNELNETNEEMSSLKKKLHDKQLELNEFSNVQDDLRNEIKHLKEEFQEKQKDMENRHELALIGKQKELENARSEIESLTEQLKIERTKISDMSKQNELAESNDLKESDNLRSFSGSTVVSSVGGPITPPLKKLESIEVDDEVDLPIYKSPKKVDPTAGRQLWCGLCERSGHESVDCPYEEF